MAVERLALSMRKAQLLQLALQCLQHARLLADQCGDLAKRLEVSHLSLATNCQLTGEVQQFVKPINAHTNGLACCRADISCQRSA